MTSLLNVGLSGDELRWRRWQGQAGWWAMSMLVWSPASWAGLLRSSIFVWWGGWPATRPELWWGAACQAGHKQSRVASTCRWWCGCLKWPAVDWQWLVQQQMGIDAQGWRDAAWAHGWM